MITKLETHVFQKLTSEPIPPTTAPLLVRMAAVKTASNPS